MDIQSRTLPTELISLIVRHLDRSTLLTCAHLDTRFYGVTSRRIWGTIHLKCHATGRHFLDSLDNAVHPVGQYIRNVHIEGFPWEDKLLLRLMRHTPHLESIVLDNGARITDRALQNISHYWPYLTFLHVSQSPMTRISYRTLGQDCHHLTHLELILCPGLQPDTFKVDFAGSALTSLVLSIDYPDDGSDNDNDNDDGDGDDALDAAAGVLEEDDEEDDEDENDHEWEFAGYNWNTDAANEMTTIDLTGLHELTCLEIYGGIPMDILHKAVTTATTINHGPLSSSSSFCWPKLTSLYLDENFTMVDQDVIPLLDLMSGQLTKLTLKDGQLSDDTLNAIAMSQPRLMELDVSYNNRQFTSKGVQRVIRYCRQLAWLDLSHCRMTPDAFPGIHRPAYSASVAISDDSELTEIRHLDQPAMEMIRRYGS